MQLRILSLTLIFGFFVVGCSSGYAPQSIQMVTNSVVATGLLTDINTGVQQDVSGGWATIGGALYFIDNPTVNPGHQLWQSSASGTANLVSDFGNGNYINGLMYDARTTSSPTRFYFLVNGTQLWTSNGSATSMIAQYPDGNGPVNYSVMGNDLYYQLNGTGSNGKVYKSVGGATPAEIQASAGTSFALPVTFVRASTHMYMYTTASPITVYSHTGSASVATTVGTLTALNTPAPIAVVGDDLYYQENTTFIVTKSEAGAASGEIMDNSGVPIAGAVALVPGTAHMYILLTAAASKIFSHTGAAGNATLIDTTAAGNTANAAATVGDDLYYQYSAALDVKKSVAGATVQEVDDNSGSPIATAVQTVAGSTHMYFYDTSASPALVYSHTGGGANATLVETQPAGDVVSGATVVGDDLYYQSVGTDKVFKSEAGAAGGEVTDNNGASFAAAVEFVAAQSTEMFIHGNAIGGNERVYSHAGAPGNAVLVMDGAVGTFNSSKMIGVGTDLFFSGASTSPVGLFESIGGALAINVGDYSPVAQEDYLCNVANVSVAVGSTLFFVANNGSNGCELWRTGGTAASTAMVADVNAGTASSNPHSMTAVGSRVYFVAQDNSVPANPSNTYLYYSDSPYTSATKVTITGADANPNPQYLTAVGSKLYFGAAVGGIVTLYEQDGTASSAASSLSSGGTLVMSAGTQPFILAVGTNAFINAAPSNGIYDLYVSSSLSTVGTAPTLITHINSSPTTSSSPTLFKNAISGNTVFFSADDGGGTELWRTDGTAANTVKIANVNGDASALGEANPSQLTFVGTSLFFTASNDTPGDGGAELYVSLSPWTSAQQLTYRSTNPQIANLNALGNSLVFTMSEDGTIQNSSLYTTDGTMTNTVRIQAASNVADVDGGSSDYAFNSTGNATLNGYLYYVFQSSNSIGNQLYLTNGSESETMLAVALNPSPVASAPVDEVAQTSVNNFAQVGNYLIFPGNNGTDGVQLWAAGGGYTGAQEISDFTPNDNDGSSPTLLGIAAGAAYYVIGDANTGRGLYIVTQP